LDAQLLIRQFGFRLCDSLFLGLAIEPCLIGKRSVIGNRDLRHSLRLR
jgi:hypothetical protein